MEVQLPSSTPSASSYWCFQCTRVVSAVASESELLCPHCRGGFMQMATTPAQPLRSGFNRRRRRGFSFNPLVVLRNPTQRSEDGAEGRSYELYYDDADGLGLRPVPPAVSATLLGSGFEMMLDRLSQIGISLWTRSENPPASKHAVAALPTVEIGKSHVDSDAHCAVCTEAFDLGSEAREMPCQHIYHTDCIVPWLNLHNSCPVCRLKLPSGDSNENSDHAAEPFGLTIWRLPGGGFAVGRFVGASYGEMPTVFSELDGRLDLSSGVSTEFEWVRRRRGGRLRRFFWNLGAVFRRNRV